MAFGEVQSQQNPNFQPALIAAINRAQDQCEAFIQQRVEEIKQSEAGRDLPRIAIELDVRRHSNCTCAIAKRIIEDVERERQIATRGRDT
jgi:hypothetical protein